ncbi:DUF7691 family protein [Streptomyces ardesiacus]|uniref:DUF7691 family protein n=1 Tax=Streptomyces ardesiacus TaxID=285564 RepID=UPI0006E4692F|nr:hypothetical protein [Streptomyces sp. NBRC 110030]
MSSSLHIYLLDEAATRALVGCRSEENLEFFRTHYADRLEEQDDDFRAEIAAGAPTAYEAVRAVIDGGPFDAPAQYAFRYGYAYEWLCSLTGSFLPNDRFTPHRGAWLSTVDEGLRAMGVTAVTVSAFGAQGLPEPLPRTELPGCGVWTPEEISRALEQFNVTMRAAEAGERPFPELEKEIVDAVFQSLGWAQAAADREGLSVVGFRF